MGYRWWRTAALALALLLLLQGCDSSEPSATPNAARPPVAAAKPAEAGEVPDSQALRVLSIAERERDGRNQLAIRFSTPIDARADWQQYVSVSRADGVVADGEWVLDDTRKTAWFRATEPNTEYQIVVHPDVPAANGQRLLATASSKLTTRALNPSVTFDDRGTLLPSAYIRGLPVTTVNVDAVDVDFHRVLSERLPEFLRTTAGNERYLQWQADSLAQMAELVYTARFDLQPEPNTRASRTLPFAGVSELAAPGVYLVVMRPAGQYNANRQVTQFTVTDLGMQARRYPQQLDVYVASLSTGRPRAGVTVTLLDAQGATLATVRTTPGGLATFPNPSNQARTAVAQDGEHLTALDLLRPALDLSAFELGARPQRPLELYIYGPRDLYRPGETVNLAALLRDGDGRLTSAPTLQASIRRPDGVTAREFTWSPHAVAYYETEYRIPSSAPTGTWELQVVLPGGERVTHPIQVEEFLPERIRVELGPRAAPFAPAASIEQPILAEYLYGAPAAGNRVETLIRVALDRQPLEALPDVYFGRVDDAAGQLQFELPPTQLDATGTATLTVPSRWQTSDSPLTVSVVASVFESGGRSVTRRQDQSVWPGGVLPGIRPAFGDGNPPANGYAHFDLLRSDAAGQLEAGQLEATLIREDRQYFWQFEEGRGWHWAYSEEPYEVLSTLVDATATDAGKLRVPVEWGSYRLEVTDLTTERVASVRFHAGEDWYARWQESASGGARPDRVALTLDQTAYAPGDVVKVRVQPPHAGEAVIVVESDRPLWSQQLSLEESGAVVEIPVGDDWNRHDVYVSATVIRPTGDRRAVTPKRAVGVAHIPLDRAARRWSLRVDAAAQILPSSQLEVTVTGDSGSEEAYVTLAAVDVGVLNITDFETPSAADYFFGQRRYLTETRDVYSQVIEAFESPSAEIRFGGGAASPGGRRPSADVRIVSLFSGPVRLDDGKAVITLDVPDFEGACESWRWRLMRRVMGPRTKR